MLPTQLAWGVASFNVQNLPDLPRAQVRECASMVAPHAGWVGFQEIAGEFDDADIDSVLTPDKWNSYHADSENKVCIKKSRWELAAEADLNGLLSVDKKLLSKGLKGVTPHRDLTWVANRFLENPLFTPTFMVDFHLVSGVYKGNDHYTERLALQTEEFQNLQTWTAAIHDKGFNVLWVADTNWHSVMPRLHPAQQWLVNNGIDKIAWIPADQSNFDLTLVSIEAYKGPSDHMMQVANVLATANSRFVDTTMTLEEKVGQWLQRPSVAKGLSVYDVADLKKIVGVQ
jgi:hypothetical protein